MANSPQARKRIKQNRQANLRNMILKSRMRTAMKKVLSTVSKGEHAAAVTAYRIAQKLLDSMVCKGIIKKNTASRYKSHLNAKVKALAA